MLLSKPTPQLSLLTLWSTITVSIATTAAATAISYQFTHAAVRLSGPIWLRHSPFLDSTASTLSVAGMALAWLSWRATQANWSRTIVLCLAATCMFLLLPFCWPALVLTSAAPTLVLPLSLALFVCTTLVALNVGAAVGPSFVARGGFTWSLHPLRVLTTFSFSSLVVLATGAYGALYGSLVVALCCGILALLLLELSRGTVPRSSFSSYAPWLSCTLIGGTFAAWTMHAWGVNGPNHTTYQSRLFLSFGDNNSQRAVWVDAPSGPELFVDGKLEATALDHDRLATSIAELVNPDAQRILVLGTGSGVVQKALARHTSFSEMITVAPSSSVAALAHSIPWLRERSLQSDPRTHLIVDEPYPWLEATDQTFDAIVCNLPPPLSQQDAKYYTSHFMQTLVAHLTPSGRAILHGLSPRETPLAYRALRLAAGSALIDSHPVSVPSVGDWTLFELQRPRSNDSPLSSIGSTLNDPQAAYLFISQK